MHLHQIIPQSLIVTLVGDSTVAVESLVFDSRAVVHGSCFFAIRGTQTDGHKFVGAAIAGGASVVVCEQLPDEAVSGVTYVKVADAAYALGIAASSFYGNPSSKLKLIGVTGTNGKTTTATLLYRIVRQLGYKAGLLSTVVNYVNETEIAATHTTPDPIELNSLLAQMCHEGCEFCFMEVSSHAVVQHRIAGLAFAGAVFSNITHDHLDYHGTFAEYIKAKKGLFDGLSQTAFAITNIDDRNGMVMVQSCKSPITTYSLRAMADVRTRIVENHFDGMLLNIDGVEVWTRLVGRFNAYNLTAIYATLLQLGFERAEVLMQLSAVEAVAGRFEYIKSPSGVVAVVDYAHTPDALMNVLETIKDILGNSPSRMITVVGCGGNRDRTKRPEMAKIATHMSGLTILTSDNPRFEEPEAILADMKQGVDAEHQSKVLTITDRREAIRTACAMAHKGDIILVAGKGHENYQEIKGVKHHFDDKEVLSQTFEAM